MAAVISIKHEQSTRSVPIVLKPDEAIYFLHIPKTAGSTVRDFLSDRFREDETLIVNTFKELAMMQPSVVSRAKCIMGHHGLFVRSIARQRLHAVTLLRDPISRSLSHYRHLRRWGIEDGTLTDAVSKMSFDEFVASPIGKVELCNYQVRNLALNNPAVDYFGQAQRRTKSPKKLVHGYMDETLLDRAIDELRACACVGVQGDVKGFVRTLCYTFGWPEPQNLVSANVTETKKNNPSEDLSIHPKTMKRLNELLAHDFVLYDTAKTFVRERHGHITPELAHTTYLEHLAAVPRIRSCNFTFDDGFLGYGFLPRERTEDGRICRWIAPEPSGVIDLPLESSVDYEVSFKIGAIEHARVDATSLTVNDIPIPLSSWRDFAVGDTQRVFRGIVHSETIKAKHGITRFNFRTDKAVQPASLSPESADRRHLALYFNWLEITPLTEDKSMRN